MPKKLTPARIAIVTKAIEIKKPVDPRSVRININKPEEMKMYLERESKIFKNIVDKFAIAGANVVICQYGMDELVLDYFSKAGILGVRHVKLSDLEMLAKATGAKIISTSREVTANDLGYAKLVEERKVEIEKYLFFEGCKNPKSVTIFLRGGTQNVIEEAERSIHDALFVVKDVMVKPQILVGAGAPEMEIATQLKKWAQTFTGKEQLAIKAYAEAIEVIPETLAENAGMNSIDAIIELRAKHSKPNHKAYGVNVQKRKIEDARKFNVYEPLAVKEQVISAAMEAATMLLRINDVLMSSKPQTQKLPERAGAYEYGKADEYSVRDGYGGIEK
jgi:chaperonin GroEL (HSP60 family)